MASTGGLLHYLNYLILDRATINTVLLTDVCELRRLTEELHNAIPGLASFLDLAYPVCYLILSRLSAHERRVQSSYILIVFEFEFDKLLTGKE